MTRDYVHDHFDKYEGPVRPHIVCANGTRLSVQASRAHYCTPKDDTGPWSAVEVWCVEAWTGRPIRPTSFKPTAFGRGGPDDPYGYVAVSAVNRFIKRHGGVK
jgi:hypothetical protein